MKWIELTYRRRQELLLWTILDKHQVIIEPGKYYTGETRQRFHNALMEFKTKYPSTNITDIAGMIGIHESVVSRIINNR